MSIGKVAIDLEARVAQFESDMGRAARILEKETSRMAAAAERQAAAMEKRWLTMGRALGGAIVAGTAVAAAGMTKYVQNTIEAERVSAQLQARIRDTGGAAGQSIKQLNAMADQLQRMSTFDDEAIGSVQAMLLTFKNIKGDEFERATGAVLDLATAMGTDANAAALQLGKALNDPVKGMAALGRSGIQFSKEQKEVIKALAESGRLAEAQGVILSELDGQMGNAAEAARDTLGGALASLKNSFENLLEGDTGDTGMVATREAVESLVAAMNDPEVQRGADQIAGAIGQITAALIPMIAKAAQAVVSIKDVFFTADKEKSDGALYNRKVDLENQMYRLQRQNRRTGEVAKWSSVPGLPGLVGGLAGLGNAIDTRSLARVQNELATVNAEIARRGELAGLEYQRTRGLPEDFGLNFNPNPSARSRGYGGGSGKGGSDKAARDAARDAERQAQSLERYRLEAERLAAELQGPLAQAEAEHRQRIAELTKEFDAHNMSQETFNALKAAADAELRKSSEEIRRSQDIVGQVNDDYAEQVRLAGMSAQQQRIETEVQRRLNDAREAGVAVTADYETAVRGAVTAGVQQLDQIEALQAQAEAYADVWIEAVDSISYAFGDWFASGFQDTEQFLDSLKNIFKRWIADVVAMIARAQLGRLLGSFGGSVGGAAGGGGANLWGSVLNAVLGGSGGMSGSGFSLGGSGTGLLSSAIQGYANGGVSGAWQGVLGSFGLGGGAAATGAWGAGLGSVSLTGASTGVTSGLGAFGPSGGYWVGGTAAGASGAGGAGASAGGASAGASGAAAAAWVLAILAGMYQNAQWYKQGWRVNGQRNDIIKASGYNIDNMAVLGADRLLQSLGVNGKWAAILSGSSGIAKAWGHQKPKVSGTGFMGSIGFDGFSGQAYADIKAKGGWFRSDKKWTETMQIGAGIDRAFDSIAMSIRGRAEGIAEQIGIDISTALSSFRLDLGKIKLDKDPEKAKQQIADKIAEVTEKMVNAAVGSLGFGHLLDDGFAAAEIMTALSASIELVTGNAKDLGRALTAFELDNITKAVEFFEGQALKNGTELGAEVERVLGVLNSYAGIMGNVNQQLRTAGLNDFQKAQLDIELQYRSQVKQLNDLAKALGLSGARAEDLAQLEQLRAVNMANLQAQMERQRDSFLSDLSLSELSPLRDDQKLAETMELLRDAVASGDLASAQGYAQTALGFGRNLYASGMDYNALYDEVTGLVRDMELSATAGLSDAMLREIADGILALPEGIARAVFNLAAGITPAPPPAPSANPGAPAPAAGSNGDLGAMVNQLGGIAGSLQNLLYQLQIGGLAGVAAP